MPLASAHQPLQRRFFWKSSIESTPRVQLRSAKRAWERWLDSWAVYSRAESCEAKSLSGRHRGTPRPRPRQESPAAQIRTVRFVLDCVARRGHAVALQLPSTKAGRQTGGWAGMLRFCCGCCFSTHLVNIANNGPRGHDDVHMGRFCCWPLAAYRHFSTHAICK